MIRRLTRTQLIIAGTMFAGGIALGLLLFPRHKRKNKEVVSSHVTEIADWVDTQGRNTIAKNPDQMQYLPDSVRRRIRHHIPDLYEATEHIYLSGPGVTSA